LDEQKKYYEPTRFKWLLRHDGRMGDDDMVSMPHHHHKKVVTSYITSKFERASFFCFVGARTLAMTFFGAVFFAAAFFF